MFDRPTARHPAFSCLTQSTSQAEVPRQTVRGGIPRTADARRSRVRARRCDRVAVPTDLPTAVGGSTATKLYFSQTNVEQIRDIQRTILGKSSGADADHLASVLRGLPPLTCVLYSKQFPRFVRVAIHPYFERQA